MKKMPLAVVLSLFAGAAFASTQYDKPGFVTEVEDGRLWVFSADSKEYKEFKEHGEPAKQVALIGSGPEGMTLKAPNMEVATAYIAAATPSFNKPGFVTEIEDGRLWVFVEGSKEFADFKEHGEPAKQVALIGAGPDGMTLKAPNMEVAQAYLAK